MRAEAGSDLDSFRYQSSYYYGGYVEEADEDNLAGLPIYERLYRQAMNVIFPVQDEEAEEEASPLAKVVGRVLVVLSVVAVGAGMAWQAGVSIPGAGSLPAAYKRIGRPPGEGLLNLDSIWKKAHQENPRATPTSGAAAPAGGDKSPARKGRISNKEIPAVGGPARNTQSKPGPAQTGAALPPPPSRRSIRLASGATGITAPLSPTAEQRRAALRGASLNQASPPRPLPPTQFRLPLPRPAQSRPKRPFSIVFSVNQLSKTTLRQIKQLREKKLSPSFAPVYYPRGTMDRVFIGSFATKKEARDFLSRHDLPLAFKRNGPVIQKLPYALQIGEGLPPAEAEVIRVILKGVGLHTTFEDATGRMLLGAYKNEAESRAAAAILSKEKISFRLIAR
jgi:hypothetical protein